MLRMRQPAPQRGLFIVGYWNCGTTILTELLSRHPQLRLRRAKRKPNLEERRTKRLLWKLGYDYFDFGDYRDVIANGHTAYRQPELTPTQKEWFRRRFWRIFRPGGDRALLLKNPYMFFFPDFLDATFAPDDIRYLVILRNGYSQTVSKDYWKDVPGETEDEKEDRLYRRALFWRRNMELYFETWYKHPHTLTLRYENFTDAPEEFLQEICRHMGLKFAPLAPHVPARMNNRMDRWEALPDRYKAGVAERIEEMQQRLDEAFPVADAHRVKI